MTVPVPIGPSPEVARSDPASPDGAGHTSPEQDAHLGSVALRAAANAIVVTDLEGRVAWANPAFESLTGWPVAEVLGRKTSFLRSGAHPPAFYAELWRTVTEGQVWHGEMVNRRRDGSLYTEEQTIAPVLDTQGRVTHFVAVKQDVSRRKETERLREDLVNTLVHDLRNPLTVIRGALELIHGDPALARPELLRPALQASDRLIDLVSRLLEVHGLEQGRLPLERSEHDLTALVEEAAAMQGPLARERGLRLLTEVSPGMPAVEVDASLVSRVLQNLLGNALKFTPAGGTVGVRATHDPARGVVVSVADDGPGIPAELRERLFQEFVRGRHAQRGSGLGLAFCRKAVEAHGGRISVESEPGRGTTFTFDLPVAGTPAEAEGTPAAPSPPPFR